MNTNMGKFWSPLSLLSILCCFSAFGQQDKIEEIEQWGVYELSFQGPADGNPYLNSSLEAKFTNGSATVAASGFYDGNGAYKIRFSPEQQGLWTYVSYFWKAGLSGGYGTHGDTFKNDSDTETEVRWWAKGGTLMGASPKRIGFFKKIMEEALVTEMTPHLVKLTDDEVPEHIPDRNDGKLVAAFNNGIFTLSKEGEYYLSHTEDEGRTIHLNLAGEKKYSLEIIDTWNMKIESKGVVSSGDFEIITEAPYTALRLIAKSRHSPTTTASLPTETHSFKQCLFEFLPSQFPDARMIDHQHWLDIDLKDTQVFYVGVKNTGPETAGDEGWNRNVTLRQRTHSKI